MRFLTAILLTLALVAAAVFRPAAGKPLRFESSRPSRRQSTTIGASNGYPLRWKADGARLKYGSAASDWLIGYRLSTTSQMTQALADTCTNYCTANNQCVTAHIIQYSGNTQEGNVLCQLYSVMQKKSDATYTTGFKGAPGRIVASWAWRRDAPVLIAPSSTSTTAKPTATSTTARPTTTSTTSRSTTSTSARPTSSSTTRPATSTTATSTAKPTSSTTSTTSTSRPATSASTAATRSSSTTSSSTSTATTLPPRTFPAPPSGATFYQYLPRDKCTSTSATVPLFANQLWAKQGVASTTTSTATRAYIVVHGAGRNFQDAYRQLGGNINQASALLIAPNFYITEDTPSVSSNGQQNNWYSPQTSLAWQSYPDWVGGSDAVAPASSRGVCSTYDVMDSLVATLNNKALYPKLQRIYLVGHSAGSSFMHHYAPLANGAVSSAVPVTYVAFNGAAFLYYNDRRPSKTSGCPTTYNDYIYGLEGAQPRYVSSRGGADAAGMFRRWVSQDFRAGQGLLDTYARYTFGDQTCPVQAQGGVNRRDRGYAMWAYKNILAGTSTDVSAYFGAKQFAGMSAIGGATFRHQNCNVAGAGHVDSEMYSSPCGQQFLDQTSTPPPNTPPGPTNPDETGEETSNATILMSQSVVDNNTRMTTASASTASPAPVTTKGTSTATAAPTFTAGKAA